MLLKHAYHGGVRFKIVRGGAGNTITTPSCFCLLDNSVHVEALDFVRKIIL